MTELLLRVKGKHSRNSAYYDKVLEAGSIAVDQDAYTAGLDRIYDVKGLSNMYVEIENTHGTNGLTYTIQKARKEYSALSDLADADFDQDVKADTNVAASATSTTSITSISPEITAIRIRVKRQTATNDAELKGVVSIS